MFLYDGYWWLYALSWIWIVVWFIIGILVAIWMYKDANAKGENGILWLVIGLLLGIIGLIIWLFYRRGL